jgi:hypothetical protein
MQELNVPFSGKWDVAASAHYADELSQASLRAFHAGLQQPITELAAHNLSCAV